MRKLILLMGLIFVIQGSFYMSGVFAVDAEKEDIVMVVKNVVDNYCNKNLDGILQYISHNYSSNSVDGEEDYAKFKASLEEEMKEMDGIIDISYSNLKTSEFEIQNSEAVVDVEFDFKGYDIDALKDVSDSVKLKLKFAKEADNKWKIVSWQ